MSDPLQQLRDVYMLLLADNDFCRVYERLGMSAIVDRFKDAQDDPTKRVEPIEVMEHFSTADKAGIIAVPEVLMYIANCFRTYIQAGGSLSLDAAFGLTARQKSGNPAKQHAQQEQRIRVLYEMACHRDANPTASLAETAEHVTNMLDISEPDCDTWVRYYTQHNMDKLMRDD